MVEMDLVDIKIEQTTKIPYIVLRAGDGTGRVLPIITRVPEAEAIKLGQGPKTPRPMTHDLLVELLTTCGAQVLRVVVTEVRNRVFYAELHLRLNGRELTVSCRPSDGIAISVRSKTPIFATEELLAEVGVEPSELIDDPEAAEGAEPPNEELVDEFRKFIEEINPEDFGA